MLVRLPTAEWVRKGFTMYDVIRVFDLLDRLEDQLQEQLDAVDQVQDLVAEIVPELPPAA